MALLAEARGGEGSGGGWYSLVLLSCLGKEDDRTSLETDEVFILRSRDLYEVRSLLEGVSPISPDRCLKSIVGFNSSRSRLNPTAASSRLLSSIQVKTS